MPGTQVLFAFLLILPFQNRFEELDDGQVAVYYSRSSAPRRRSCS